jgi:hypothetical protein
LHEKSRQALSLCLNVFEIENHSTMVEISGKRWKNWQFRWQLAAFLLVIPLIAPIYETRKEADRRNKKNRAQEILHETPCLRKEKFPHCGNNQQDKGD